MVTKVYTSETCGYCRMLKEYMAQQGIVYTEMKVDKDPSAYKEYQKLGIEGVPVTVHGDHVIVGYDKERIDALIGKKIVECPQCRKKLRIPRHKGLLEVKCPDCATRFKVDSNV